MTMWEFSVKAKAYERMEHEQWHKLRVHASLVLQPHLKGDHVNPKKILPLPGDTSQPGSNKEEFQEAMKFFLKKKWIKDKVIH